MAADTWYYGKEGNQVGPVPADTLRRMLADGQLRPTDPVWQEGMADWVAAASGPGLAMAAPQPTQPAGAAPPFGTGSPQQPAQAWPQQAAPGWPQQPAPGWPQQQQPAGPGWPQQVAGPDPGRKKAETAAKASWTAVLVGVGLNMVANATRTGRRPDRAELLAVGLASFAIYVIGLICGIYALTQVRKYGPPGIRTPAIVGVILNGLIVAAFVAVMVLAASL
jgi:hypothetical protein